MNYISLPATLPGDRDLAALNRQLHAREAVLDWQAVTAAPPEALATLLAGLDVSNDADVLGIDSCQPAIVTALQAHFATASNPVAQPAPARPTQAIAPATWQPDAAEPSEAAEPEPEPAWELEPDPEPELPPPTAPSTLRDRAASHPYDLRAELQRRLLQDLLGPSDGEREAIAERSVRDRYLVGMLAPHRDPAIDDRRAASDQLAPSGSDNAEEGSTDEEPSHSLFPNSLGLTFCAAAETTALDIAVEWGSYRPEKQEATPDSKSETQQVWRRFPYRDRYRWTLAESQEPQEHWLSQDADEPLNVLLRVRCRRLAGGDWIGSVFLVNQQRGQRSDAHWLFQPQVVLRAAPGQPPNCFSRKPLPPLDLPNADLGRDREQYAEATQMAMLYRQQVEFAVGHGTSVAAQSDPQRPERAWELRTTAVPDYEVPISTTPTAAEFPALANLVLAMRRLAEVSPAELPDCLQALPATYAEWLNDQAACLDAPDLQPHREAAERAIANGRQALARIRAGIDLLARDPQAAAAFQFANRAMWQQRLHSLYAARRRQGEDLEFAQLERAEQPRWRTFQLAFILLNLPSATDLHHPERSHPTDASCDLLWFPTGGGKTEAYLGLAAYVMGLRRLQGVVGDRDGGAGVAVLMRYTLRLLTLQQFQRATTLICACEAIRRADPERWGQEPFRIGLWVGSRGTPNTTQDSGEALKAIKQARGRQSAAASSTPHQLTNCPWCGTAIEPGRHIHVDPVEKGRGRTLIYCGDSLGRCLFSQRQAPDEGLPVVVVDEEIYRRLPTLLIATADKFAQMPWKGEIQNLFGRVSGYCPRHGFRSPDLPDSQRHPKAGSLPAVQSVPHRHLRPPDLIIQDELHLIAGPLGSLVGLYETAIDTMATWTVNGQPVRPKVIASTATIRQAGDQVRNLFLRQVQIFPPPGLDIADNFFSRQRSPSREQPGRLYLGICAPGRRLKATMIRVYLAALAAAQSLYERDGYGAAVDPWMTLVGYFNSLRELGGMRRLVDDDIRTRLRRMEQRGLADRLLLGLEELTSRQRSTDIPQILDRLEVPFEPEQIARNQARRKARKQIERPDPLDIVLATNMISVGVDVQRLGLMVVCGQPKNTAEYIQATSRVGRNAPGLVLTVYNWARPRDLSHYERFAHYHATFYQNVEALSVTPFASGALDRGLSALLVALVRLQSEQLNPNAGAGHLTADEAAVTAAIAAIATRAEQVAGPLAGDRVRSELAQKYQHWLAAAANREGGRELHYRRPRRDRRGVEVNLLEPAGHGEWQPFTCLNSLRNVEPSIGLIFKDAPPDESTAPPLEPFVET